MSLPSDFGTRLGGALMTGGAGISAPYSGLPADILTRTLFQYKVFDFTSPWDGGKSGADTVQIGTYTDSGAATFTHGWLGYVVGAPTLTALSGSQNLLGRYGAALALSPGSVNNTGWYANYVGSAAAGGTGLAGKVLLGAQTYPKTLAFGGSMIVGYTSGTWHTVILGLSAAETSGSVAAPGTLATAEAICLHVSPTGVLSVVGRRGDAGSPVAVPGGTLPMPTGATQVTRVDWVVRGIYTNPSGVTTFSSLDVHWRANRHTATAVLTKRPSMGFSKGSLGSGVVNVPNAGVSTATPLVPFIGTCNPAGSAATLEPWHLQTLWYAVERD